MRCDLSSVSSSISCVHKCRFHHCFRFAPTYETATTRRFYHARTETVRSCTSEACIWCQTMEDHHSKVFNVYLKLDIEALHLLYFLVENHATSPSWLLEDQFGHSKLYEQPNAVRHQVS